MLTSNFDYDLPEELIAQSPHIPRDECRMLVLNPTDGSIRDRAFKDVVDYLSPGDLLVANETRVIPARLLGTKRQTGGECEILLLREVEGPSADGTDARICDGKVDHSRQAFWEALVRPGKRLRPNTGAVVDFKDATGTVRLSAEVVDWAPGAQRGERIVRIFTDEPSIDDALHKVGHTPLPPYIKCYEGDSELYQTVYSKSERSAAAPTAGLHFTPELIAKCKDKGVGWKTVDLEVGLDTFRIVDEENAEDHVMHTELYSVPEDTIIAIERCKARGGKVVAVGTTSVRSLESAWDPDRQRVVPRNHESTNLFLLPGSKFNVVDSIITNFHVPRSTLMMLVSAFAGTDNIMSAYAHAIDERYRMLSFGDAMLILPHEE